MRHRKAKIVLNKSKAHTKAVVRNLITSLVDHGRIKTTSKKAKILKQEIEKLISRSKKREQVQAIREADKVFFNNDVAKKFFQEYLPATKDRTSGYVRTYLVENRAGDNATQVIVELIDHPANNKAAAKPAKSQTVTK